MDEPLYHLVLEGRRVGPYDRRTIVGMRIKNMLTSDHALEATDGSQLTVADLVRHRTPDKSFQPLRSGSFSLVKATYSVALLGVRGRGWDIPRFRGEVEARVQADVLRLAGRYRERLRWQDGRIKLPLKDMVHARLRGSRVDIWLRSDDQAELQQLSLDMFTSESAGEFVEWLPNATPWPEADSQPVGLPARGGHRGLWVMAGAMGSMVLLVLLLMLVFARTH